MSSARTSISCLNNEIFFLLACILFFLTLPLCAEEETGDEFVFSSSESAFSFSLAQQGDIYSRPQKNITIPLFIRNNTDTVRECVPEVQIPDRWKVILPLFPVHIDPGASEMILIGVYVPAGTEAGQYHITCKVHDKDKPTVSEFFMFPVNVAPEFNISVEHVECPSYAVAGFPYTSIFSIVNQGNTDITADIQIQSMDNLPYSVEPVIENNSITLPRGSSVPIKITVKTNILMKYLIHHRVEVRATIRIDWESTVKTDRVYARAYSFIDIIPRISGDTETYHLLPVFLGVKGMLYYDELFGAGLQASIKSKGTLDETNQHHLEVNIEKNIETNNDLLMHPQDVYFVRYFNPIFDIYAGDTGFDLSPLSENDRMGRGTGASVSLKPFRFGAYYHTDPASTVGEYNQYVAGFGEFYIPDASFRDGFAYKADVNLFSTINENIIIDVQQRYRPLPGLDLDLDAALGGDFNEALGYALYFQGSGLAPWFSYKLACLYGDPSFPGTYRNMYLVMGNMGFSFLANRLKINTTYQQQQRNITGDPGLSSAYTQYHALINASYVFGLKLPTLSLTWKFLCNQNRFPLPEYDIFENDFNLTVSQPFGSFKIGFIGEVQSLVNITFDQSTLGHKYHASLDFKPDYSSKCSFVLGYEGEFYSFMQAVHRIIAEASFNYAKTSIAFDANLKNRIVFNDTGLDWFSIGIMCGFTWTFLQNQKFNASASYTLDINERMYHDALLILSYSAPVSVPVSKKMSIGAVRGKVIDELTGESVRDIVVHINGMAAVTDAKGEYAFYSVKPGNHYLDIERKGFKTDYIPVERMPMQITVEKGQEITIDIHVTQSSMVRGHVYIFENKNDASIVTGAESDLVKSGFSNILLELSDGTVTKRRLSDKNGYFAFEELLPGNWSLKALGKNFPEYHHIEKDFFTFVLKPGDRAEADINILPDKREIVFLDMDNTLYMDPVDETMQYELDWGKEATARPTAKPTPEPTAVPSTRPTDEPTHQPTGEPTDEPSPTPQPEVEQTSQPTDEQTSQPEVEQTSQPTDEPTDEPASTPQPEVEQISAPTDFSKDEQTDAPTDAPIVLPEPTDVLITTETDAPAVLPTETPLPELTLAPTIVPTVEPALTPTIVPTTEPTIVPSAEPTTQPAAQETTEPTFVPTIVPVAEPTLTPTIVPTMVPTTEPTLAPTIEPTKAPVQTASPAIVPTILPSITNPPISDDEVPEPRGTLSLDEESGDDATLTPEIVPGPTGNTDPDEVPEPKVTLSPY